MSKFTDYAIYQYQGIHNVSKDVAVKAFNSMSMLDKVLLTVTDVRNRNNKPFESKTFLLPFDSGFEVWTAVKYGDVYKELDVYWNTYIQGKDPVSLTGKDYGSPKPLTLSDGSIVSNEMLIEERFTGTVAHGILDRKTAKIMSDHSYECMLLTDALNNRGSRSLERVIARVLEACKM